MTGMEILTYSLFAYAFIVALIAFILVNDLRNPRFFQRCLRAALLSFAIGIILELTRMAHPKTGMSLAIMSIPVIYLGYYQVFRRIFAAWKGTDPYVPFTADAMGAPPIGGFWAKYSQNRKIMWTDYLFNAAQLLILLVTIIGMLYLINHISK